MNLIPSRPLPSEVILDSGFSEALDLTLRGIKGYLGLTSRAGVTTAVFAEPPDDAVVAQTMLAVTALAPPP